jgi:hypothetical protein
MKFHDINYLVTSYLMMMWHYIYKKEIKSVLCEIKLVL